MNVLNRSGLLRPERNLFALNSGTSASNVGTPAVTTAIATNSGDFRVVEMSDEAGRRGSGASVIAEPVPMSRHLARRHLEIALGVLWLIDGLLQLQPFMFSREFYTGVLGMANMGLPGPVADGDYHVATLLTAHPALWNSGFALLQLLLGLGILWRRTSRVALICSVPWAVGVWIIGEGFGAMFMPGTSLLTGAPGAALLYALVALMLLPTAGNTRLPGQRISRSGLRIGAAGWALIWTGGALLELEGINHAMTVPSAQIANGSYGEPAVFRFIDMEGGRLIGQHGYLFALVLGLFAVLAGWGMFVPGWRRVSLAIGIVMAVFVGVVGQDLGAIFTGRGTDPGSGPVLILLALALWRPRISSSESKPDVAACIPTRETEVSQCHVGSSSSAQQPSPVPV
jgi:hypothetical protein